MTREVKTDDLIFISHPPTTPIPMPLFSSPPPFFLVPLHPSLPLLLMFTQNALFFDKKGVLEDFD